MKRTAERGSSKGSGHSRDAISSGESWPDHWSLERDRSYGFTLKVGGNPEILKSRGASLYALGGIRRLEGRFTTRFKGCMDPSPCSSGGDPDFISGRDSRDLELQGWTAGIGMEKMLGQQIAFHAEILHPGTLAKNGSRRSREGHGPGLTGSGQGGLSLRLGAVFLRVKETTGPLDRVLKQ